MKSQPCMNVQKPANASKKRAVWAFRTVLVALLALFNFHSQATSPDSLGVRTVIIDPGHGGKDPGCLGSHSHEADVALAISLKFGNMLKDKYGSALKVIYTRTTDEFVGLQERANMANKYKGDLFICIHANASANKESKGSEVYALGLHREDSQRRVADRENESILMEENHKAKYGDFDTNDPDRYLFVSLLSKTHLNNSLKFAEKISNNFQTTPKLIDRGVKQAGFLVLHQVNMPSVLIETGFLTNKEEEEILNDAASQEDIAKAIFNAFVDYKSEVENINNIVTGKTDVKDNVSEKEKEKEKANQIEKDKNTPVAVNNNDHGKDKNMSNIVVNTTEKDKNKGSEKDKPVVEKNNPAVDNTIYFMVQITASTKQIECNSANFKGLDNILEHPGKGIYRYTYGKSPNFEEAKKLLSVARDKGYKDAFIVAYQNGERIEINKAIGIAKQ
ncbi:MAG TPA: N-acetylmuramoyl-L-alanine amidase [Flavobacteriales bacterium]|nr:N-acetylmuramoyl-L-alanine amidase [Flavobacteriales bacterium]